MALSKHHVGSLNFQQPSKELDFNNPKQTIPCLLRYEVFFFLQYYYFMLMI